MPKIPIKTAEEVRIMRDACRIAATVLDRLAAQVAPGVTTWDLDQAGRRFIEEMGATSACYNYRIGSRRYPAYTCISVNEEVVHGIGSLKRTLKPGDAVTLDVSVVYNGYIGDTARTILIGPVAPEVELLVRTAEEALVKGIAEAKPGNRVGDISYAIQRYVEARRFSVVRDFVGHGVGRTMHEEPQIPNYGRKGKGDLLGPGMTLAIEPMVNMGLPDVEIAPDGWTALTVDRKPSAHFEHTVLITEDGPEILTVSQK